MHAWVREIPWTGQIGDSARPELLAELEPARSCNGQVVVDFGDGAAEAQGILGLRDRSSAPAGKATAARSRRPYAGSGATRPRTPPTPVPATPRTVPRARPADVSKFYTSGGYDVGGLRTGSDGVLDFAVDVPQDGTYDLSVFANSLNTYDLVTRAGPDERLPARRRRRTAAGTAAAARLQVGGVGPHRHRGRLTRGTHRITLAAQAPTPGTTKGDAIVDKLDLVSAQPRSGQAVYDAEYAALGAGARTGYGHGPSGPGVAVAPAAAPSPSGSTPPTTARRRSPSTGRPGGEGRSTSTAGVGRSGDGAVPALPVRRHQQVRSPGRRNCWS